MTSFMGPMAPPPAAPAQPQALDIRTDPNRRQQFKQFMKQRTSMAPMVSAPIAQPPMPMMPPPMPMGGQDIDIFNPVNLHDGGIVPSLNSLQQQAAQFSQKLQSTVMGDSQGGGMGAGFGGSFNSGGGMGGGGFSSPGFTTNTTSGGLVPGGLATVSPPPDANVSDFFQNFNNTNSGESYMKMSDHPAFTSEPLRPRPTGENSYLNFNPNQTPNDPASYANSTIDQGFYESDLFKNLDMSGPKTMDMRPASEATGGFSGSSTDINRLQDAYQQYLQGGQQGGMQQAVVNPQVDPNPFISGQQPVMSSQQPMSSSVTNSPTTVYRDYGLQNIGNLPATIGNMFNTIGFEDGGAVPPRRTDIRGQDHMLSYITPDEADILKALGGSGEAGPMGIPSYPPDGGGPSGSGGASGSGDHSGGEGSASGADTSGASDDDMGDVGTMDGTGGFDIDVDSVDVAQDQQNMGFDVFDSIDDFNQQQEQQQQQQAQRDRAVKDAFVTNSKNEPVQTATGYLSKDKATEEQVAAGYKAMESVPGSRENLAAAAAANAVEAVSGVPTDPLSSNKTSLLGFNFDLLNANIDKAIEARKGMPTQVSPLATSQFNAQNLAAAPVASAPPSNVVAASVDPLTQDPMTVARAMQDIQAPGLMDLGIMSNIGKGLQSLVGTLTGAPTQEEINAAYANRSPDLVGISPGLAIAALGVDKGIPAAGMIGMTTDGKPAAITGDMLADINTRSQDDPLGLNVLSGIFNDMTLSDASASKVAVVDPATNTVNDTQGRIVGAIDGYGRYTGNPDFNPYASPQGQGGDGPDQTVKAPTDPCPDGFVMKDGACTPIETSTGSGLPNQIGGMIPPTRPIAPVIVPSPRSNFPGYSLQGPVGYGSPIAGQAAPSVASNAAMYQQMMLQGMRPPLRLEDGGAVPPRNVEISGQDHMLSYITPDEADILKSLGGSGKPGPMGIPAFDEGDGPGGSEGAAMSDVSNFYYVPVGQGADATSRRIYIGSSQDTVANRQAGSSSLASATQGTSPGILARDVPYEVAAAANPNFVAAQEALAARQAATQPDPVAPDPVVPEPVDPNAYNPIMDVVVPSTRLQDFPASAPPDVSIQPMPMPLQGPVGYGSPEVGQMSPSVVSNAAMYQDMLNQPFPLNFQQGGSVSSNLDMAADNFLKALMPAA